MGEANSNPNAQLKKQLGLDRFKTMSLEDVDNVCAITELARIGLNAIKSVLPEMKSESEKAEGAKYTKEEYERYRTLAEVAGPKAYAHFDAMAKFLVEQISKELKAKKGEATSAEPPKAEGTPDAKPVEAQKPAEEVAK